MWYFCTFRNLNIERMVEIMKYHLIIYDILLKIDCLYCTVEAVAFGLIYLRVYTDSSKCENRLLTTEECTMYIINILYTVQYISDLLDFMEQQVYVMYIKTCFQILCVSIVK